MNVGEPATLILLAFSSCCREMAAAAPGVMGPCSRQEEAGGGLEPVVFVPFIRKQTYSWKSSSIVGNRNGKEAFQLLKSEEEESQRLGTVAGSAGCLSLPQEISGQP